MAITRTLGWLTIKHELVSLYRLIRHPRAPRKAKWLVAAAVIYVISPIDFVPDWFPLLGQLDDVVLMPLLLMLAWWVVPDDIRNACRNSDQLPDATEQ